MATVTAGKPKTLRNGTQSRRIHTWYGRVNGKHDETFETFIGDDDAARSRVAALQLAADRRRPPQRDDIKTFDDLMERVYELPVHWKRKGKPKAWTPAGKATVRTAINCYLNPASVVEEDPEKAKKRQDWITYLNPPGPKRFDKLSTAWWDGFFGRITEKKFSGGPASGAYVERIGSIVHAAYEQGRRWSLLLDNPLEGCTISDGTRGRVRPPTDDELSTLFHLISGVDTPFFTFVYLAADLGERRGEGVAFRWEDIDLERATIGVGSRISCGLEGPVLLQHTKARDHDSPRCSLSPETVELLVAHKAWLREQMAAFDLVLSPRSWVFPRIFDTRQNPLEPWRPDYVTKRFTKLRRRVNLDHVRFHDLRHYVATEMIADGRDIVTVAARLRDNPTTVLDTYAYWRPQADKDAVASHGKKLAGLRKPKLKVVGE